MAKFKSDDIIQDTQEGFENIIYIVKNINNSKTCYTLLIVNDIYGRTELPIINIDTYGKYLGNNIEHWRLLYG